MHIYMIAYFNGSIKGLVISSLHLDTKSMQQVNVEFTLKSIVDDSHDVDSIKEDEAKQ